MTSRDDVIGEIEIHISTLLTKTFRLMYHTTMWQHGKFLPPSLVPPLGASYDVISEYLENPSYQKLMGTKNQLFTKFRKNRLEAVSHPQDLPKKISLESCDVT